MTNERTDLVEALRKSKRVNMPCSYDHSFRIVGFEVPVEIAWPEGGSAHTILDYLVGCVESRTPIGSDLVERMRRRISLLGEPRTNWTAMELEYAEALAAIEAISGQPTDEPGSAPGGSG